MKVTVFILGVFLAIISCSGNEQKGKSNDPLDFIPDKEAVKIAVKFTKSKISAPQIKVFNNIVFVKKGNTRYEIRPENIFHGLIDSDTLKDVFISIPSYSRDEFLMKENLILLKSSDSLRLAYIFEEDIDVMKVENRIIYGEIHKKPRSSPLYNCDECKEKVKYKFEKGTLIKGE